MRPSAAPIPTSRPSAPAMWTTSSNGAWTVPTPSIRAPRSGPMPPTASGATGAAPASWPSRSWPASATSATWWPTIWSSPTTAPSSSSSRPNAAVRTGSPSPTAPPRWSSGSSSTTGPPSSRRRCRSNAWPSRPRRLSPNPARRSGPPANSTPWAASSATACASGGISRRWAGGRGSTPSGRRWSARTSEGPPTTSPCGDHGTWPTTRPSSSK